MDSDYDKFWRKLVLNSQYGSTLNMIGAGQGKSIYNNSFWKVPFESPSKPMIYKKAYAELVQRKKERPLQQHSMKKVNSNQYVIETIRYVQPVHSIDHIIIDECTNVTSQQFKVLKSRNTRSEPFQVTFDYETLSSKEEDE